MMVTTTNLKEQNKNVRSGNINHNKKIIVNKENVLKTSYCSRRQAGIPLFGLKSEKCLKTLKKNTANYGFFTRPKFLPGLLHSSQLSTPPLPIPPPTSLPCSPFSSSQSVIPPRPSLLFHSPSKFLPLTQNSPSIIIFLFSFPNFVPFPSVLFLVPFLYFFLILFPPFISLPPVLLFLTRFSLLSFIVYSLDFSPSRLSSFRPLLLSFSILY